MSHTQATSSDFSELKFLADRAYDKENQALISSLSAPNKPTLSASPAHFDSVSQAPETGLGEQLDGSDSLLNLESPNTGLVNNFGDSDTKSLIAIIGMVLALQAKSNSQYWSNLWQQATTSMNQAVALAPMIYTQVTQSYQEQSNQTQDEANSAFAQGMTNSVTAGLSILIGGMAGASMASDEPKNPASQFKNQLEDDTDESVGASASKNKEIAQDDEEAIQNLNKNTKTDSDVKVTDKMSRSMNSGRFMKGLSKVFEALQKAQAGIQIVQSMGGAANNFIDNHYKSDIASIQIKIGQYEGLSKELEQFASYYQSSFQRAEDLRSGSQNNIDTAMQILKSIADTMTQTTQSMFRG